LPVSSFTSSLFFSPADDNTDFSPGRRIFPCAAAPAFNFNTLSNKKIAAFIHKRDIIIHGGKKALTPQM
jgi:hypothetical protein